MKALKVNILKSLFFANAKHTYEYKKKFDSGYNIDGKRQNPLQLYHKQKSYSQKEYIEQTNALI